MGNNMTSVCQTLSWANATLVQSAATKMVLPAIYTLMFAVGITGNTLSLWVFQKKMAQKTSTHVYLTNLIVSNVLVCVFIPFIAAYFFTGVSIPSESAACHVLFSVAMPLFSTSINTSVMFLCSAAISRYSVLIWNTGSRKYRSRVLLCRALLKRFRSVRFAKWLCAGWWCLVLGCTCIFIALYIVLAVLRQQDYKPGPCLSMERECGFPLSHVLSIISSLFFTAYYLISLVSYALLVRYIYRSQQGSSVSLKQQAFRVILRNTLVIQAILGVCSFPFHIFSPMLAPLLHRLGKEKLSALLEVKSLLLCLAVLRSCLDPLCYLLMDKGFRRQACQLLCRRPPSPMQSDSSGLSSSRRAITQTSQARAQSFRQETMELQVR